MKDVDMEVVGRIIACVASAVNNEAVYEEAEKLEVTFYIQLIKCASLERRITTISKFKELIVKATPQTK